MDRLERFVARRRWVVLAFWIVLVVAAVPFASHQTDNLTGGGFESKGSTSQTVAQALQDKEFEGVSAESLSVVFDNRKRDQRALAAAVDRVQRDALEDVEAIRFDPQALQQARTSSDAIVIMPLVVTGNRDQAVDDATTMRENLELDDQGAVPIHLVGQSALWAGVQVVSKKDLEEAEGIGLPLVLIILLIVFGSLAAAALPLTLGVAAVVVTGAVIFLLSRQMHMSIFVTNMASMLGIGVAVDYSLFILARYREEIRDGLSHDEARAAALRTSGLAVVFSGVTVIVALSGLFLIPANVVHSMAIGAIVVVAVAVLAATTLLPALIALLGHRVSEPGKIIGKLRPRRRERTGPGFWERWTSTLMKRPLPFAIGATALMLLIAAPALTLKQNTAAVAQLPKGFETRVGFELAQEKLGKGALAPVDVLADYGNRAVDKAGVDAFAQTLGKLPNATKVQTLVSTDGHKALVVITPTGAAEEDSTLALVNAVKATPGPAGAHVDVGGPTAQNHDDTAVIMGSLWKVLLFVMALSFIVLLLVLRSALLPIKAVLMNLLSVAAAYGVLVIVFQWGWADSILGIEHLGYIQGITPALLLAIVFGLSMDYEVFMLSRIKERYQATGDNRKAVAEGLAASAKTISSAALIMVCVFLIFAFTGVPQVQEIGIGLAAAIALDATVVRLILVPTTMELMGKWNWWLPQSLDRVLPDMDFESSAPKSPLPEEAPAAV